MICSSKHVYGRIGPIKDALEKAGHQITLPNSYEDPMLEERTKAEASERHVALKAKLLWEQGEKISSVEAILVVNFEKGSQANYIGGATFLECYKAFELGKKIYLMNPIPRNAFEDELRGMSPVVINQDLGRIPS